MQRNTLFAGFALVALVCTMEASAEPYSSACHQLGQASSDAATLRMKGLSAELVTERLAETQYQELASAATRFAFRYQKLNSYAIYDFVGKYCMLIDDQTSRISDPDWQLLMQYLYSAEHCVYTGASRKETYISCMRDINPLSRQELEDKRGLLPPR